MIQAIDLVKIYKSEDSGQQVAALRGCDFHVKEGEFVSVVGPSGAGKTTLLRLLGGIEKPSSGQIMLDSDFITSKSASQLREIRRKKIGFVSQSVEQNLIQGLSVRKNLELAMRVRRLPREAVRKRSDFLLQKFDLESLGNRKVSVLSGGEKLRTSVAAALAKEPKIVLADEPTGKLDSARTITIRRLFREISAESGVAIIVATHDPRFRIEVDRSLTIADGRLVRVEGETMPTAQPEEQLQFVAYIDSTGFIQIPRNIRDHLGLQRTVLLELDSASKFAVLRPAEKKQGAILHVQPKSLVLEAEKKSYIPLTNKSSILAKLVKASMVYGSGKQTVEALRNINLEIFQGEFVIIVGPSGSGKSTLLHIIAGLEKPTSGTITVAGQQITKLSDSSRAALRARKFGLMAEKANLHPSLTVHDNITLSLLLQGHNPNRSRAIDMLKACQIESRIDSFPHQLSEGEKQRAALVAAFIHDPSIVILDEPTSHLESSLAAKMIDFLFEEAQKKKTAVILATHDLALLKPGFRMVALDSGMKVADQIVDEVTHQKLIQEFYGIGVSSN
ncbi:MAG: ABC transporter ATP-binding protein [Candidatus Hodarchaeota archaeon]